MKTIGHGSNMKDDSMACLCGGNWSNSSNAGAFAMNLDGYRTDSGSGAGGRASVFV